MTTATGTCGNCGAAGPVGAMHVFRGAGIVLRCPHCDNALVKIVEGGTPHVDGLRRHANAGNHPLATPCRGARGTRRKCAVTRHA